MLELAERAVRAALSAGADYADARIVRTAAEDLRLCTGELAAADAPFEFGLGVRALVNGAVGYAAVPGTHRELADLVSGVARRAARTARDLAPARRKRVMFAPGSAAVGTFHTPVVEDPFGVPVEEKLALLAAADAALIQRPEVVARTVWLTFRRSEHWLATSEGTGVHQVLVRSGGGLSVTAARGAVHETRSLPDGPAGGHASGGFEVVRALDLVAAAAEARDEALALCGAPLCPPGRRTVVLGSAALARLLHETLGPATDLERMLGEGPDAGALFGCADLAQRRFGAACVDVTAVPTLPGGLDTRGFDDEGTPLRDFELVRGGTLVGAQSTRSSAAAHGSGSNGAARAAGWHAAPAARTTNLRLAPGTGSLAALLARTEDGALYIDTARVCTVDPTRRTFALECEVAYEVRGGRLAGLHRRPTLRGGVEALWGACDAVAGPEAWRLVGFVDSAPGEGRPAPLEVSHGAAPARFRGLAVSAP